MPRAPKACATCPTLVRGRTYCDACAQRRQWQGGGYSKSRAEHALRDQVLAEEPCCRDCGALSTEAGHIVGHAQGGRYVRDNLKGQCRPCNIAQMLADRAACK